jgi:tripartite-type tricarboxylate transporter receptor subunit TctC
MAVLLAVCFALTPVQAQDYPSKPIKIIVPTAPAGIGDMLSRIFQQKLAESGNPVTIVVENRAGAAGVIGTDAVAKSPPDGTTFLLGNHAVLVMLPHLQKVPYDPFKSFNPVILGVTVPNILVVHPSVPANSVRELVAYAKANPGKLTYASQGVGASGHIAAELFKLQAGIDIVHVPYKGGGPAVQDLVAGQVPMGVLGSTPLIPHHKAGRIRIVAFTSKDRFSPMPEIPTVHESGFPGFDTGQWLGLLAPRGTPADVIQRLQVASAEALALPEVKERLAQAALEPVGNTPQQFAAVIRADVERWTKLGRELGLEPQ